MAPTPRRNLSALIIRAPSNARYGAPLTTMI